MPNWERYCGNGRRREGGPDSKTEWRPRQDFRACSDGCNGCSRAPFVYPRRLALVWRSFCCGWLFSQYDRRQALMDSSRCGNSNQDSSGALMNRISLFLFLSLPGGAWAQLMSGSAGMSGISFSYETRLETPTPAIGKNGGGVLVANNIAHRHFCDFSSKTCFGYDLSMDSLVGCPNRY